MKKTKQILALGFSFLFSNGIQAQELLPAKGNPLLVETSQTTQLANSNEGEMRISVYGKNFTATSNSSWLKVATGDRQIQLTYDANREAGKRSAEISIENATGAQATLTINQPGNAALESAASDWLRIFPTGYESNQCQPGSDIDKTQDNNYSTVYHSDWNQSISEEEPAILTYYFDTPQHLDMVTYVPTDGNGKFGKVDIYYKQNNSEYVLLGNYDFKMYSTPTNVYFGSDGMDNITAVEFRVKTGYSFISGIENYASCAEMEFKKEMAAGESYLERIKGITAVNEGIAAQSGEEIERTLDQNTGTLFHTDYHQAINADNPAILRYTLNEAKKLQKVIYVPRKDGQNNGNFGMVEVAYRTENNDQFTVLVSKDFGKTNNNTEIDFTSIEEAVKEVRFTVSSGAGNFASCAEMEFYETKTRSNDYVIFKDELYTQLVDGTTQTDIDALTDPFVKELAQDIFDQNYNTDYRVAEFPCLLSPHTLSAEWNTPGKLYDQLQGVTGINISKGRNVVIVSGANPNVSLTLKVVAWYAGELVQNEHGEWIGVGPAEKVYSLTNGVNIINYDNNYDGLAYISYYADENPENYSPVQVHFVYGQVNGYLTPDKTNEEMHQICANARNTCMDLVGKHVHSVWTAKGLHDYCKASDGTSLGYRQYMNVLDSLIAWEHRLLGFQKYDRVPQNKTMAYVNYTYYMFQGGYGVSFKFDQEQRVLNCQTLMHQDGDAIWGLSHEWGHQHQMQPYFCWAGLGESSNNMNSCENVLRMGYHDSWHAGRIKNNWNNAYTHFFEGKTTINKDAYGKDKISYQYAGPKRGSYINIGKDQYQEVGQNEGDYVFELEKVGPGAVATKRNEAYRRIEDFSWSPKIQEAIREQFEKGSYISDASESETTVSTNEVYVEENTAPFYMLHNYFSYILPKEGNNTLRDFQMDLYEALRQNDNPEGSTIEPGKTEVDKYELLASAQNGNKNKKYAEFVAQYPNSCWVKNGYIHEEAQWTENSVPFIFNYIRKASRICGYNLFDYFDKFGFLRTAILVIDDYGNKCYALTKDMKAEFKADMEALNLKEVDAAMMEKIAHSELPVYETPIIPN